MSYEIELFNIEKRIEELDRTGKDNTGAAARLLYSPQWLEARRLLKHWMGEQGLAIKSDSIGNLYGRLQGTVGKRIVLTGSHIDTVINGGAYDGVVGVVAGLEALRVLNKRYGHPRCSIEVVAICDEEGTRFGSSFIGSRIANGLLDYEAVRSLTDCSGISLDEAMKKAGAGIYGNDILQPYISEDISAFIELHVEQGSNLYDDGIRIGVVKTITGQIKLNFILYGTENHAGTTPMYKRKDALTAAAEMILAVERLAGKSGKDAVATVGVLDITPNVSNVVPGKATFTADIRHPDKSEGIRLEEQIRAECSKIAAARCVDLRIEKRAEQSPVNMDDGIVGIIDKAADALGMQYCSCVSGAGHDAQIFSQKVKTGMIFVPSINGISHNPKELTDINDIGKGTELLAEVLYRLAY